MHVIPVAVTMDRGLTAENSKSAADDYVNWREYPAVVNAVSVMDEYYTTGMYGTPRLIRDPQEDCNTDKASLSYAPVYYVPK
jgi:hypothetical protein